MVSNLDRANMVVGAAKILAIDAYAEIPERYPQLKPLARPEDLDNWMYFITIAAMGTAFSMVTHRVPAAEQRAVKDRLAERIRQFAPDGYEAMADFLRFVKQGMDHSAESGLELPDVVGAWVLFNLKRGRCNDQEIETVKPLGALIVGGFGTWWESTRT